MFWNILLVLGIALLINTFVWIPILKSVEKDRYKDE